MKTGIVLTISMALLFLPGRSSGESDLERDLLHSVDEYLVETVIAVHGINDESNSLDADLLRSLTEYLAATIAECGTYKIVPPWDVQKVLKLEKVFSGEECVDPECQLKLAAHLGAGKYVSTRITRTNDICTVESALDDVRQQTQLIAARAKGDCSEQGLVKAIEDVAYFFILWGGCKPPAKGVIEVDEDLYRDAAKAGARRPVLRGEYRLPDLEEINGVEIGSVPDVLVAVGWTLQRRELDQPYHGSNIGPGVRMDVRLFMRSFVDIPVLRDLGIAGMYNVASHVDFDIEDYGASEEGSTTHWRIELQYRLAFNDVVTQPAILFRSGFGQTSCEISGSQVVKDAGYSYPYLGLDAFFMPYEPYLRIWTSGAIIYAAQPSEDLTRGPYSGLKLAAGLDVVPTDHFFIGLGYEWVKFFDVVATGDDTESTDSYLAFFLRAGCAIH